jgi:hypothetical protein
MAGALFAVLILGLIATTALWSRAERHADREAELREQVETLTQELLELVEQLRSMEIAQAPEPPAHPQPSAPVPPAPVPPAPVRDEPMSPEFAQSLNLGKAPGRDQSTRSSRPRAPASGVSGGSAKATDAESEEGVDADLAIGGAMSRGSVPDDAPAEYAIVEDLPTAGALEQTESRLEPAAPPRMLETTPSSADKAAALRAEADKKLEQLERLAPGIARQYRRLIP